MTVEEFIGEPKKYPKDMKVITIGGFMTEFPHESIVSNDDLLWFSYICIMIGISDKRAIDNNVIDDEDLNRIHRIMDILVNE